MMNYSRIIDSVDIQLLADTHIVIVGAGGSYNLILNFARSGIGKLTVLDFDTVEDSNIVRQGYTHNDIERYKVEAVGERIAEINPDVEYEGIIENFLDMDDRELDRIFGSADMFLFLTDSFDAQALGNILALKYNTPALWAGWYARSRTAEIFFQIPAYTPACFRCAVSSRYEVQEQGTVKVSSNCNTIFHSELLDSYIGMLVLGILHREDLDTTKESSQLFKGLLDDDGILLWNFLHLKVHPLGGNPLFDEKYGPLAKHAQNFVSCWQAIEPDYGCPDCKGALHEMIKAIEL